MKSSEIYMEALLELALESGASDLHLTVGRPPVLRLHGALETIDCDPLEPADTERLLQEYSEQAFDKRILRQMEKMNKQKQP